MMVVAGTGGGAEAMGGAEAIRGATTIVVDRVVAELETAVVVFWGGPPRYTVVSSSSLELK